MHQETIRKLLNDDVTHGFSLPLPVSCLFSIPAASLAPLGVQSQKTIDEDGNIIPKFRMTHDQTFPGATGTSVNIRTLKDQLPDCLYGKMLLRIIHYIVSLRARHPGKRIIIGKYDIKAAYRRCHLAATAVTESLTIFDNTLFAALRLTFGGAAGPSLWSLHSEVICDLANDLIQCPLWNHNELHAPIQHWIPPPIRIDSDEPFAEAQQLAVDIPVNDAGLCDVYLDDIPPVCLDEGDNAERCAAAVPLALHLVGRSLDPEEPIPRDDLVSVTKTLGEGAMAEDKTITGWMLRTRQLLVQLTDDKFSRWSTDLDNHLSMKTVAVESLDSTLGRVGHVGIILPASRHFLSRLRHLVTTHQAKNHRFIRVPAAVKDDLRLFKRILSVCHRGVSMNNIVYRKPTHLYRSDASSYGLGGYNIQTGRAWRHPLPRDCLKYITLNTLEFIGCVVTLWTDIALGVTPPQSCLLSQTDSTSADGWLYKSNFNPSQCPFQLQVARHLASITIEADVCLYSQWFPGEENIVSDMLSRRFDLTDPALTSLILSTIPEQVPYGIQICPLPNAVNSWLTSLLQTAFASAGSPITQTTSKHEHGPVGIATLPRSASTATHSSATYPHPSAYESSAPSPKPSGTPAIVPPDLVSSLLASSKPPSRMWRRPFGLTTGQTHDSTLTEKWRSFYNVN